MSSNFIDASGRGPLSESERILLARQRRNQESAQGSPAEVERRQAAPAVGMASKIAPRADWIDQQRGPTGRT